MNRLFQSLNLSLLNVGHAQLGQEWDFENVLSPFTRIYYVSEGNAKVYHTHQEFNLQKDHLYLIPSYTYSRYKCDTYHEQYYISCFEGTESGPSIYNLCHFDYEVKAKEVDLYYFKRLLELNPNRALTNINPKVYDNRPTLERFEKSNSNLSPQAYLETHAILRLLFSRFVRHSKLSDKSVKAHRELGDILNYIGEHLHTGLNVKQLAQYSNLSTDYFSRMFNEKVGMRPNLYIQTKRVERAQLLLLTTNNSIKQIAAKVGLENFSYFSRVFKSHAGKSPGSFRREQFKNGQALENE